MNANLRIINSLGFPTSSLSTGNKLKYGNVPVLYKLYEIVPFMPRALYNRLIIPGGSICGAQIPRLYCYAARASTPMRIT